MSYVALPSPSRLFSYPGRADNSLDNPSSNQQRNIKSGASNPSAYSASPSQLSLSSDLGSTGLPNPYQQAYGYGPGPHDPTGFGFPSQPQQHYRAPQMQPQQQLPPPQQIPQHHQHQQPLQSPPNPRKRRASEIDTAGPGQSASGYGQGSGMMTASGDLDVGLGGSSQGQLPAPATAPVKKGRTNTPWTPAEEQRLKAMRDAGSSWSEIAKTFPLRTEGSVKKHWYKDMHYADFAEDESAALLQAIKDYENNKWKVIGQKVGKPAKACEAFAKEQGWKV